MNKLQLTLLLLTSFFIYSQKNDKAKIIGSIIEKQTKYPIEYATISILKPNSKSPVTGGITNAKGKFDIELNAGTYDVVFEFIGYKRTIMQNINISNTYNFNVIELESDSKQIEDIVIRKEKTSLDIKLDKKLYTVGKDIIVKGGTVSDVLDNIPSVSVASDGTVSMRGNENVRILIDGRPSNAINVADALKLIPAESIDKVEMITNPSARYEAEGGAGILNIILKKGKNNGVNGTLVLTGGYPRQNGISGNVNIKSENFNFFSTVGYNNRSNPGRTIINTERFDSNRNPVSYVEERRVNDRYNDGINANFGFDYYFNPNTTWTNSVNFRNIDGGNNEEVIFYIYDGTRNYINSRLRDNVLLSKNKGVEFSSNFIRNFKKQGHKLTADFSVSQNSDRDDATILGKIIETGSFVSDEISQKKDKNRRTLFQLDYVLPINEDTQFETGFRGNYNNTNNIFAVSRRVTQNAPYTPIEAFTNNFTYKEDISAFYVQGGTKLDKLSIQSGIRYEFSDIDVSQEANNFSSNRIFNNLFPSALLNYQWNNETNFTLNYSKRIQRPRDRFINPFTSYTSDVSLFFGNPYLNPSFTDALDFGIIKKFSNLTLTLSTYYNQTNGAFQLVRRERGDLINGVPVIENTFFNLGEENRLGIEVTANFSLFKWWKINSNFNFFNIDTKGKYEYLNLSNLLIVQNFDFVTNTWTARANSRINLPAKIDFQANINYFAPQKNGQGLVRGLTSINLALSKDILKDKATISFNVSDLLNTRRRIFELTTPNLNSYSNNQFRIRTFTLSFTYRFNKLKNEKESTRGKREDDGGDF